MENLKEIALRVAGKMPEGFLWKDGSSYETGILEAEAIEFSEALIAEIAKENEPVAWVGQIEDGAQLLMSIPDGWLATPLYAFPPSTEQIENRVAEACAELLDTEWNGDADTYAEAEIANQCAEAIRSGAWKEYLK